MAILDHLKLRDKLLLMVAVPLLGLLYFALGSTWEKYRLSQEMTALDSLAGVSTRIGALAHELQKERGMSAGLLGSRGANFANELPVQHAEADRRLQEFQAGLEGFGQTRFGGMLKPPLDEVEKSLADLRDKRRAVLAQSIPAPEAIAYYTRTIAELLAITGQVAILGTQAEISRNASAYAALLQSKERAGIERALLSNAFGAGRFSPDLTARFLANAAAQDAYLAVFQTYATDGQKRFYTEKVTGPVVEEVARFKKAAIENLYAPTLGMDAAQWFAAATGRIDLLKGVENHLAGELTRLAGEIKGQSSVTMWLYLGLSAVAAGLTFLLALVLIRRILGQIGGEPDAAVAVARNIANGKLDNTIALKPGDSGSLLATMGQMQNQLRDSIAETRRLADESLRVKIALDNVNANVMMADTERRIIYMNKAVGGMFRTAEADIRTQLPQFDAGRLMGASIDVFHKNPAHQVNLLASLTGTYKSTIKIGGRTMTVIANPVVNERGERLGSVVEWADRTAEVAVEEEVAALVEAAAAGDFGRRLELMGKEGFFRQLSEGINKLVETSERGMNDVARVLGALSNGDLGQRMEGDYQGLFGELKGSANSTGERLKEIVGQIREATDAINTAAREIAAGNTDLSSRTESQASSLEETASSMDQLTSTVRANAENAQQANQLARGASEVASKGGVVVGEVVHTMKAIAESSKKIADIIGVIDGIAFQTNILALNAAVEAARAGEQGRGFAVVAGEVRNLAQRSAAAAKEIKGLISDSADKVGNGYKLVEQAGQTMAEVVQSVKRVTDIMGEITAASTEQSQGIEQVNAAVAQMDEMTQQNAALVEEAAAASLGLREQADGLAQAVAQFRVSGANVGAGLPARTKIAAKVAPTGRAPAAKARPAKVPPARGLPEPVGDGEWEEH